MPQEALWRYVVKFKYDRMWGWSYSNAFVGSLGIRVLKKFKGIGEFLDSRWVIGLRL